MTHSINYIANTNCSSIINNGAINIEVALEDDTKKIVSVNASDARMIYIDCENNQKIYVHGIPCYLDVFQREQIAIELFKQNIYRMTKEDSNMFFRHFGSGNHSVYLVSDEFKYVIGEEYIYSAKIIFPKKSYSLVLVERELEYQYRFDIDMVKVENFSIWSMN